MKENTRGFLSGIESPFFVVVLVLAGVYVAGPFLDGGPWGARLLAVAACFALALGVVASRAGRVATGAAVALAVAIATLALLSGGDGEGGTDGPGVAARVALAALSMLALVAILRFVLRARDVSGEEIFAAIAAYLLLGFFWSYLYFVLHVAGSEPPAFAGLDRVEGVGAAPTLTYFSFVTLTTLGYGDVVPVHPAARSLATFEALTGQLFIAVLLARLVALRTAGAARDDG